MQPRFEHASTDPDLGPQGPRPVTYALAIACAIALIGLGAWLKGTPHDVQLIQLANALSQGAAPLWSMITVGGLGLSVFIVFTALAHGRGPQACYGLAALLWCFPLGGLVSQGLKKLFDVARPAAVLAPDQLQVIGERLTHGSMPSGHSITAGASLAVALACWRLHPLTRLGLILLALLIGVSRNAVAAHWPSDVAAGLGVGVLVAMLSLKAATRPGLRTWLAGNTAQRLLGTGQIAAGISMLFVHTGYPLAVPLQWVLAAVGVGSGVWRWMATR
jgi:membrane-associated phospholipid phosphatase